MSNTIHVPDAVRASLAEGAALAISISGGKDSQAMLIALAELHASEGWPGDIYAIHADLGRAEWQETPYEVEHQAQAAGVPLIVVQRERGDLFDRIAERAEKLAGTGKPPFPSAAQRYCTSDLKRGPINKHLRAHDHVVCAMGMRAGESHSRAKKPVASVRKGISTARDDVKDAPTAADARKRWTENDRRGRLALDWLPLKAWSEADVWRRIGHTPEEVMQRRGRWARGEHHAAMRGFRAHGAYVRGNERLSCALCILGSRGDLINGARHKPKAFRHLLEMERESGFTFRQDLSLEDINAAVERGETARPDMQTSLSLSQP